MSETLGDALPKEIARVRDEVLPEYLRIGRPGILAATMMQQSLDAASKAMIEGDVIAMLRCFEELKGYELVTTPTPSELRRLWEMATQGEWSDLDSSIAARDEVFLIAYDSEGEDYNNWEEEQLFLDMESD